MQAIATIENASFLSTTAEAVVQHDTFTTANVTVRTESGTTVSAPKRTATALLEQLVAEKDSWFNNAYRTSNEQLYVLLAKCYDFYFQLKAADDDGKKLREGFDEYVKAQGYVFSPSSHTLVKIVKCVFGADRRRVSAYGIVLRTALQKELASDQVADFIRDSGGVEEVRLSRSPNAMTAKQKAAVCTQTLGNTQLSVVKATALEQALDAGNIGKPVVLIGTWQSDGSIAVHAYSNAAGAVNAALASHYTSLKAEEKAKRDESVAANDSSIADKAIANAASEALAA